jgi:hypothetical protein
VLCEQAAELNTIRQGTHGVNPSTAMSSLQGLREETMRITEYRVDDHKHQLQAAYYDTTIKRSTTCLYKQKTRYMSLCNNQLFILDTSVAGIQRARRLTAAMALHVAWNAHLARARAAAVGPSPPSLVAALKTFTLMRMTPARIEVNSGPTSPTSTPTTPSDSISGTGAAAAALPSSIEVAMTPLEQGLTENDCEMNAMLQHTLMLTNDAFSHFTLQVIVLTSSFPCLSTQRGLFCRCI